MRNRLPFPVYRLVSSVVLVGTVTAMQVGGWLVEGPFCGDGGPPFAATLAFGVPSVAVLLGLLAVWGIRRVVLDFTPALERMVERLIPLDVVLRLGVATVVMAAWGWFWVADLHRARFAGVVLVVPILLFVGIAAVGAFRMLVPAAPDQIGHEKAWGACLGALTGLGVVWVLMWIRIQTAFCVHPDPSAAYWVSWAVTWLALVSGPWLVGTARWPWATVQSWPTSTARP